MFQTVLAILFLYATNSNSEETTTQPDSEDEDSRTLDESIRLYGPFRNYVELGLPGPALTNVGLSVAQDAKFENDVSGNYSFEFRATTKYFVYIARYEKGELEMIGENSTLRVKGQFSETFKREKGGDYVKTVGYTIDENGYKTFLLDLSTVRIEYWVTKGIVHLVGLPTRRKMYISSVVLASLSGGNLG
ncbi:uncharacterized protein [Tenebrio molitor]|uniref:uncharacterized protein n=1 Tax=Tenebrio molitor TaxID=7067 RepID=UPI003624A410